MPFENFDLPEEEIVDLGNEGEIDNQQPEKPVFAVATKTDLNPYDIFKLAKGILIVATSIYVFFALIKIFWKPGTNENAGITEVWDYSKVVLNSIVSLVLGLYFGSKQDSKSST